MRRMKDSGIAWIGEIPEAWEVRRLKSSLTLKDIKETYSGQEYIGLENVEAHTGKLIKTDILPSGMCNIFAKGDVLFAKLRPYLSKCFVANFDGVCSTEFLVLNTKYESNNFFKYVMISPHIIDKINSETYGAKMPRANWDVIGNIKIPTPPLPEQRRIADYLDTKCAEIDRSMELVRQSIDKLKEYKKSVITEVVTKGLDPDVPMKDSGVPWIGEMPEDWAIQRMKNIATVARGGSPRPIEDYLTDDENGINWIKIGDTIKGYKFIDKVQQKIRIDGLTKTRIVHKGDLILTNSMSFGEPYILNIDGAIHDGWVCLQDIKINIMFLYYLLCSQLCLDQFKLLTSGGVVQNLNIEKIGSVTIFIPSHQEQERIAAYLDAKCAEIDTLITQKQALLDKLAEYKKSLIFECVTGKREVAA